MAAECELQLFFAEGDCPELVRSVFYPRWDEPPIIGVRSNFAPANTVNFRWNTTNHAICVFLVKARIKAYKKALHEPILVGDRQTMAASIGRVFKKQKLGSIFELFGFDISGRSNLNRMILCYNYNKTMRGGIRVYFRSVYLKPEKIRIFTGTEEISRRVRALEAFAKRLETSWAPYGERRKPATGSSKSPPELHA